MTSETGYDADRTPRRVRHELKFRRLTVASVETLSPQMKRIVVQGTELEGFTSPGFDDHLKLVPPLPGEALRVPEVTSEGVVWFEPRPAMRDYTPRAYDPESQSLTIDFAVGHGGPATAWAEQAKPGDEIGIGGPRGSMIVPVEFATHLLIGDEAALPAIARRLEDLPAEVSAVAVIEVEDKAGELALTSAANLKIIWVHRQGETRGEGTALSAAAVKAAGELDASDAYVWAACESSVARALRPRLLAANSFNPKWMKVAGYWRRGAEGLHEVIED
jgi:NADPH-dependent ferric siderophore reductase